MSSMINFSVSAQERLQVECYTCGSDRIKPRHQTHHLGLTTELLLCRFSCIYGAPLSLSTLQSTPFEPTDTKSLWHALVGLPRGHVIRGVFAKGVSAEHSHLCTSPLVPFYFGLLYVRYKLIIRSFVQITPIWQSYRMSFPITLEFRNPLPVLIGTVDFSRASASQLEIHPWYLGEWHYQSHQLPTT